MQASETGIRRCRSDERGIILEIINDAAQAYRDVIPADCWHEPYMDAPELDAGLAAGIAFWGLGSDGRLDGVMGIQRVADVELIRHAYVRTRRQGQGIGAALLAHLIGMAAAPLMVGTWSDATWAIRFYERHGFRVAAPERTRELLRTYWSIPDRQIETSVVLELSHG